MSQPTRDDGVWVNSNLVTENLNKMSREEYFKHAGQFVALSLDGSRVLASAATELELVEQVDKLGLDPSRVIFFYFD